MKILVVDDDEINCEIISEMLKHYLNDIEMLEDSVLDVAHNGKEAIEKFNANEYDVIFMDVVMPEIDGFEATRQIRLLDKKQPSIIMVTALNDIEQIRNGFLNGANWYITKPYDIEVLEILINDIIANKTYLQDNKKSIVDKKTDAKTFMSNFMFEFSEYKLEKLNEELLKNINNFMVTKDRWFLQKLSQEFLEYSKYIKETKEFDKIAFALLEISEILKTVNDEFDIDFFIDFMFSVLSDLRNWSENIFINQIAIDIHYLDESLITSIMQLRSLLKQDEELEEEEIEFF